MASASPQGYRVRINQLIEQEIKENTTAIFNGLSCTIAGIAYSIEQKVRNQYTTSNIHDIEIGIAERICIELTGLMTNTGNPITSDYNWNELELDGLDEELQEDIYNFLSMNAECSNQKFRNLVSTLQKALPKHAPALGNFPDISSLFLYMERNKSITDKNENIALLTRSLIEQACLTNVKIEALYHFPKYKQPFPVSSQKVLANDSSIILKDMHSNDDVRWFFIFTSTF